MKYLYKLGLAVAVWLYQLSGGKLGGKMNGFKVLLLTTTGRKSGRARTIPLGQFDMNGGYVVVASNGGSANHPAWFYNLKSNPRVKVQVLNKVMPATAEVLSGDARAKAWQQVIATAPGYANYAKRTRREIPLVVLHLS